MVPIKLELPPHPVLGEDAECRTRTGNGITGHTGCTGQFGLLFHSISCATYRVPALYISYKIWSVVSSGPPTLASLFLFGGGFNLIRWREKWRESVIPLFLLFFAWLPLFMLNAILDPLLLFLACAVNRGRGASEDTHNVTQANFVR